MVKSLNDSNRYTPKKSGWSFVKAKSEIFLQNLNFYWQFVQLFCGELVDRGWARKDGGKTTKACTGIPVTGFQLVGKSQCLFRNAGAYFWLDGNTVFVVAAYVAYLVSGNVAAAIFAFHQAAGRQCRMGAT